MVASLDPETHHECRLPTTNSATAALRVVRWRGRDITKMYDVQVAYVYPKFHRWGAEEGRQIAATKAHLTVLTQRRGNLPSVSPAFDADQPPRRLFVKLRKELIRLPPSLAKPLRDHPLGAHRVRRWWCPVSQFPLQCTCLQLNSI